LSSGPGPFAVTAPTLPSATVAHDPAPPVLVATSDGERLVADLAVPTDAVGGAVICHPHPRFGGDRTVPQVEALVAAIVGAGRAALRFDFRGVGRSTGAFGGGIDERRDATAALDRLADEVDGPLWLVGCSFGADVALSVDHPRLAGWVAVAPPLTVVADDPPAGADDRPTLVLSPVHDQFRPPASARAMVAGWTATTVEEIAMADHLLAGRLDAVAARVVAAITTG